MIAVNPYFKMALISVPKDDTSYNDKFIRETHIIKTTNSNPTAVLEVRDLIKHYPGVIAVDGVSFAISPGICFGLIGPNGAGKTTTIEIIEGIIPNYSGTILYKGSLKTSSFKEEVGIQFQATSLFSFLSVQESLETFYNLYRDPMPLENVIRLCRLEDILNRRNDKLSGDKNSG